MSRPLLSYKTGHVGASLAGMLYIIPNFSCLSWNTVGEVSDLIRFKNVNNIMLNNDSLVCRECVGDSKTIPNSLNSDLNMTQAIRCDMDPQTPMTEYP